MDTIICRDLYMRHTNTAGQSWVIEHRVWDAERFVAAQRSAAEKLNADVKGDRPRLAKAEQITRDNYLNERTSTR
jgi:hypothetical protein